jgi:ABC-type sugar transport system ATPase subunit
MLRVTNLTKRYGGTIALAGLSLDASPGAILGIAGPNGAGKSTLVRILAGEERFDGGAITFGGEPFDSAEIGVAVVHQEPESFPNLTVRENLVVGQEGTRIRRPTFRGAVDEVLVALDLLHVADRPLEAVPLSARQRTEIARAMLRNASVFLFDEPNSALTEDESKQLFVWMRRLADRGAVVLFVTHRLGELVEQADAVAVIRDGRAVKLFGPDAKPADVGRALVTDEAGHLLETRPPSIPRREVFVRLENWRSRRALFRVAEVELLCGEVVAVVGVEGSGGREFVASLAGQEPVGGRALTRLGGSAEDLFRSAEYLPASRQSSLFENLSLAENAAVRLGRGTIASRRVGFLHPGAIRRFGESVRRDYGVASSSANQPIRSLSGGNQQKIAIAATLANAPSMVAIEEPTRGVDVGSRAEIHRTLRAYATSSGALVTAFCTEISEVFQLADRVFVMDNGQLSVPLDVTAYDSAAAFAGALVGLERHSSIKPHGGVAS